MYHFPKNLYADVRVEETYSLSLYVRDDELLGDYAVETRETIVRVYDGTMWYSSTFSDLSRVQEELDALALLAAPNPAILEDEMVKRFEVHRETVLKYEGEDDARKISREQWKELLDGYIAACSTEGIPEISTWWAGVHCLHRKKSFWSSKGAEITQDIQSCDLIWGAGITVDGVTTYGGKTYCKFNMDGLRGHEEEILAERDRYLDFARRAVDVEPGEYPCVLAPFSTAMFTHESFGHKSEADYMLNDRALREEWVLGKQVGSAKVSICDSGDLPNMGYVPYDDEGTKARETWLIRDGLYIYNVDCGTGLSTFTINPILCYRIREGKLCEPVRVNVLTGSVFETLYDIDAVGNDLEIFDTYTCGKWGQTVNVSAGGPSIRVKKLKVS